MQLYDCQMQALIIYAVYEIYETLSKTLQCYNETTDYNGRNI